MASDLIVATNDAKYVRVAGRDTYPREPGPDTLSVIDASAFRPRLISTIPVATSIAGPPQAVAITPDGSLAVVSAPSRYDHAANRVVFDTHLQIVDLRAPEPRVVDRIEVRHHPQGVAINRAGDLLLAATLGGTVGVLAIDGNRVTRVAELTLGEGRLAGIAFTHDGSAALVALRDDQGLAVLEVAGRTVTPTGERISTGVAPYAIDVSSDGRWAVVCNVGLAGLGRPGRFAADADTCTLIDVSRRPFRAVQHFTAPSVPEGIAVSPDGRWIAVQAMDGSNLPPENASRRERGKVLLYENRDGHAVPAADLPGGEAGQGVVFTADSRYVLAQFNVEKQIAVFAVGEGRMTDTGVRLPMAGGPASIRSLPR